MLQAKSPLAFLQCATSLPVAQGYAFAIIDEVFGDCHIEENVQKARFILLEIERAKQYVRTLCKTAAMLGLEFLARTYTKIYQQLALCCERLTGTTTGKWSIFPGGVRFSHLTSRRRSIKFCCTCIVAIAVFSIIPWWYRVWMVSGLLTPRLQMN